MSPVIPIKKTKIIESKKKPSRKLIITSSIASKTKNQHTNYYEEPACSAEMNRQRMENNTWNGELHSGLEAGSIPPWWYVLEAKIRHRFNTENNTRRMTIRQRKIGNETNWKSNRVRWRKPITVACNIHIIRQLDAFWANLVYSVHEKIHISLPVANGIDKLSKKGS